MLLFIALAAAHTPLCVAGETATLSCEVKGGKTVSLCANAGGLSYRFGKTGAVELESSGPFEASKRTTGEDSATHMFSFAREGHRYVFAVDRTEDQFDAKLVVRKGADALATLPCVKPGPMDLTTDISALTGDPKAESAWVGVWRAGDSKLVLEPGLAIREGEAFWHGQNPGQIHTGEAKGPLTGEGTVRKLVMAEGCEITLTRRGPDLFWAEDNLRCGGMNVSFTGEYSREP